MTALLLHRCPIATLCRVERLFAQDSATHSKPQATGYEHDPSGRIADELSREPAAKRAERLRFALSSHRAPKLTAPLICRNSGSDAPAPPFSPSIGGASVTRAMRLDLAGALISRPPLHLQPTALT
jgi:hypothetical protein